MIPNQKLLLDHSNNYIHSKTLNSKYYSIETSWLTFESEQKWKVDFTFAILNQLNIIKSCFSFSINYL